MRTYSRHIRNFALLTLLLLSTVGGVNAVLDPYQILHDQLQSPAWYSTNQRFQAAGLIHRFLQPGTGYDSAIIGTSMTQNFRPSEVSSRLGWKKTLPLPVSGATPWELRQILKTALETGNVRHALIGLFRLNDSATAFSNPGDRFPLYIYQGNPTKYLLSADTLRAGMEAYLFRNSKWGTDLDTLNFNMRSTKIFNAQANLLRMKQVLRLSKERKETAYSTDRHGFPAFDEQLLPLIKRHPETEFICFFPPYSLYYFATLAEDDFERLMDFYGHAVAALSQTPNARIFGFDTCFDFTGNLANYSDEAHYRAAMNSAMLQSMAAGRHRLTPGNWPEYRRQLTQAARDYRLKSDFAAAEAWIPEP